MNIYDSLRILLLEDHGLVRAGFKALLKTFAPHAQVYEAARYEQAVMTLVREPIDFAFLDFKLAREGDKSGLDVLHFIREQELVTRAIIVSGGEAASGYLAKALVLQCISAGAFGYIPKAMEGDGVLREAFETVLSGRVFLPAFVFDYGSDIEVSLLLKRFKVKNRTQLLVEIARLGLVVPKPNGGAG